MAKKAAKKKKEKFELDGSTAAELESLIAEAGGSNHASLAQASLPVALTEAPVGERVRTGMLGLDVALGGGLMLQRQYEISGIENIGKTQRTLRIMGEMIRVLDRPAMFIDLEGTLDTPWAIQQVGEDVASRFYVVHPQTSEVARMQAMLAIREGYSCVAIDSVGVIEPDDTYAGMESGDVSGRKGAQASFMSQTCRSITNAMLRYDSPTMVIWINQLRMAGILSGRPYQETMGGKALRFACAARIGFSYRKGSIDEETGVRTVYGKILKSKIGPPFRSFEIDVLPDGSIDPYHDLVSTLRRYEILTCRGSYYYLDDVQIAQGFEGVLEKVRSGGDKMYYELYDLALNRANDLISFELDNDEEE